MKPYIHIVTKSEDEMLLKDVLSHLLFGNKLIRRIKSQGGLTVNGNPHRMIDPVHEKDQIEIQWETSEYQNRELIPSNEIPLIILFEDPNFIVFEKPYDLPIHPSARHLSHSVGNYFSYLYPDRPFRPIGRLDKDTTGCALVAKNGLAAAMGNKEIHKKYYAIVEGILPNKEGFIEAPIYRPDETSIKRIVDEKGEYAKTLYKVINQNEKYTLVECILKTGRTHQIRVHFSHIGYPLAGDPLYGGHQNIIQRQALHLGYISFKDPGTQKDIEIHSPIPEDMKKLGL